MQWNNNANDSQPENKPNEQPVDAAQQPQEQPQERPVEEKPIQGDETQYTFTSHRGVALLLLAHRNMEVNEENISKVVNALPSTMLVGQPVYDKDVVLE